MSAESYARFTVTVGALLGTLVIGGCSDGNSRDGRIDASSDVAPATDTASFTATDTSDATSSDGLTARSPDTPIIDEAPAAADGGYVDNPPGDAPGSAGLDQGADGSRLDNSPRDALRDAALDQVDGGCLAGQSRIYSAPGCGDAAQPVCLEPTLDACAMLNYFCECDGVTTHMVGGCGGSDKPYLHQGACTADAATDGEASCRMELEVFTCQPGWTTMLCCPPTFDGTLASVPGCDPENLDESTSAGNCDGLEVLHRVSATGGTITCSYATTGVLVGTYVRAGSLRVIPFCMTSRTAISGDDIPATCDPTSLAVIRSCAR